ncbi:MAG: DNA-protecting protein DprA [Deltaproteobacteria bacterium]|nr:DNA-protecting protein DprA [Deltaproteobacteria bacterium]
MFLAGADAVARTGIVSAKTAAQIGSAAVDDLASKLLEECERCHISIATKIDRLYPERIRPDNSLPAVLFWRGEIACIDGARPVAVVGTRTPDHYGEQMAIEFGMRLAESGLLVVSGGARGVDSFAHEGALMGKGPTVAVLGTGLDVPYPPENAALFNRIIEKGGCVISEFQPGTEPNEFNFPRRNRTVAALSEAVVVVQGGERSGALITADLAFEMKKQVFALMGNADNMRTAAPLMLRKKGAEMVASPDEVLAVLNVKAAPRRGDGTAGILFEGDESAVFGGVGAEPVHIDDLAASTGLPAQKVSSALLALELKGAVRQIPGMRYVRAKA